MKRTSSFIVLCFVVAALVSMSVIGPAQAYIESYNWIGATYEGSDSFYGRYVVAYKEGLKATLVVSVRNHFSYKINVSAVKVGFDWNINYSSTECNESAPLVIEPHQSHAFTIEFTVPSTANASNLVTHRYTIFVEHVTSTADPKKVDLFDTLDNDNFAVYSSTQADAQTLYQELNALFTFTPNFTSPRASVLWSEAKSEALKGATYYGRGNFDSAKAAFQSALDSANKAFSTEKTMGRAPEMTWAYGWLIISIGVVLIGAGVAIYGLKKPKV
jgi:hypothetical protein